MVLPFFHTLETVSHLCLKCGGSSSGLRAVWFVLSQPVFCHLAARATGSTAPAWVAGAALIAEKFIVPHYFSITENFLSMHHFFN